MASPFMKVPAQIHELHSYFIHVVEPIPCVRSVRYSHHLSFGMALSLSGSSSFCLLSRRGQPTVRELCA